MALHLAYLDVHLKVGNLLFCAVDQLITKKVIFLFNLVFFYCQLIALKKLKLKELAPKTHSLQNEIDKKI